MMLYEIELKNEMNFYFEKDDYEFEKDLKIKKCLLI
jgi:hypothetical protein